MKPSIRALVASAAALTTGLIAGPLLLGGGDAAPVAYAMIDGQSAYFVAIPAYRTMDSREEEPVEKGNPIVIIIKLIDFVYVSFKPFFLIIHH